MSELELYLGVYKSAKLHVYVKVTCVCFCIFIFMLLNYFYLPSLLALFCESTDLHLIFVTEV